VVRQAQVTEEQAVTRMTTYPIASDTQIAKREHRCELCGGTIQPGEAYRRVVMDIDGYFSVEKWHLPTGKPDDPCRPRAKARREHVRKT
jgi:hypothetical protein